MNLDIRTGVQAAFYLSLLGVVLAVWLAVRRFKAAQKLLYFRKRQEMTGRGWRTVLFAILLAGAAVFFNRFAEPIAYQYFPPSPTVTQTPTITLTPSMTVTPSITLTPTITNTPSVTNTPSIPEEILSGFLTTVSPDQNAVFSPLVFGRQLNKSNQPLQPASEFKLPIKILYGSFSFDKMTNGSQWTALWYRGAELVCVESLIWDGGSGGYGYTECSPESGQWQPGEYVVQIFVGTTFKTSGNFVVLGDGPTPTVSLTPTLAATPGLTPAVSPSSP